MDAVAVDAVAVDVAAVLAWADANRRDLPWRRTRDPWAVLVSEVMLQQTQVARVVPRWQAWLDRWPTPTEQADAGLDEVLVAWSGLGYPRRARNLWLAARRMVEHHGGEVPRTNAELLGLPGVGPYTARAVRVFAFEHRVGVLDTNVGRILARWCGRRLGPAEAQRLADDLVVGDASWRWNQGLFDLAAALCTRRAPRCEECPARRGCAWAGGVTEDPASSSAGVSRSQGRFEGSHRQARGRLLRRLAEGAVAHDELVAAGTATLGAAESLRADGLVVRRDGAWHLG